MNIILQMCIAILCLFFVWRIYRILKDNPDLLNRDNLTKSFSTMGVLGLILIGFVAILVWMVKQS